MILASNLLIPQCLPRRSSLVTQALDLINRQDSKTESIRLVPDRQFQRRIDIALLLVPTHMHQVLPGPRVSKAVHKPRVRVEAEHDRAIVRENRFVFCIRQAMRMVPIRLQLEQIHDVYKPDLQERQVLAEQRRRGKRFLRRHITARCDDDIWL